MTLTADTPPPASVRRQRIVRNRRQYNQWVANQTLEDFALRFTAQRARTFSAWRVANTAMGSIAFLACEAIGASVAMNFGFANAAWALLAVAGIFAVTGLPICYHAAKYGVDMDLLTRGAGFGYLGSTVTSAIYASFTFILFAIEAAILSEALKLCFGIPLAIGHMISALIVIPFAAFGIRRISWLQGWTQPIWLVLQIAPLVFLAMHAGELQESLTAAGGPSATTFNLVAFGGAAAVLLSLLPQIGEQVDYLRFLPSADKTGRRVWWAALLAPGPGWILVGGVKILIGGALALLALRMGFSAAEAAAPTTLYNMTFQGLFHSPVLALVLTGLFVAVCQIKINVTNAYAGSIASANFFARLTHRHPGRVVWLVFNVLVALMLMEMGILGMIEKVLSLYSNFAVAWIGAVTADLLVNKPLGLSPKGIEFKRAYLYDVNPVGAGAMLISVTLSCALFFGAFGPQLQALSPLIGFASAFLLAPLIAWATKGKYYLARPPVDLGANGGDLKCSVCQNQFETPDVAHCPIYQGPICSLCCALDARCHDACKEKTRLSDQAGRVFAWIWKEPVEDAVVQRLLRFTGVLLLLALAIAALLFFVYLQQTQGGSSADRAGVASSLQFAFMALTLASAFVSWYLVLAEENRRSAEEESDRQTGMLIDEIEAHKRTDTELQRAKETAEGANLAKSRYIVGISHEIRTPLNAISGYAQLLERNPSLNSRDAVRIIRRSAAHLGNLVDGLLDISRIENGSLRIERSRVEFPEFLSQIVDMFRLQAMAKGISFQYSWPDRLPEYVYTDEKRLRQVLINLLSNAIKYTESGGASLSVSWRSQVAEFIITDTGCGIAPGDLERIFLPFERLPASIGVPGIGLGLTISNLLVSIMGGEINVESMEGGGSTFRVKLFMSDVMQPPERRTLRRILGYQGTRRKILVTDDDATHLDLVREILEPLDFTLLFARDAAGCLAIAARERPDLVMLDVAMPGMSGWEAAHALRRDMGEEVAILMVSANAHELGGGGEDAPHDDYLIKPYEIDDLLDRIRTQLGLSWAHSSDAELRP